MEANRRAGLILNHIAPPSNEVECIREFTSAVGKSNVVIVSALRTPIGKSRRGSFKDTHFTDLLAVVLKATVERTGIDVKKIEDLQVGNVLAPGGGAVQARMAMFLAGYPYDVPVATLNRQCSSGLQAFANIAGAINLGAIDIGIAAGVESMSLHSMVGAVGDLNDKIFKNELASACLLSMGQTSENVAAKYNVTREVQDRFAASSQEKACRAQTEGMFDDEIVPVTTKIKAKDGSEKVITVTKDDGPRPGTTFEKLQKLRPAFKKDGTSTAGNSSQTSDGAAAVLACSRSAAHREGLPIIGSFKSFAVKGVPPEIMGVGPAYAIPEAVKKAGLTLEDIDIFEINEAFASQATWCVKELGIPLEKVNPLGGAIALGHPLGCTGARMIATLLHYMRKKKLRYGVVSMCIGTGMGAAAVFEAEY